MLESETTRGKVHGNFERCEKMICSDCKTEFPANFRFCEKCGAALIEKEIPYIPKIDQSIIDKDFKDFFKSEPKPKTKIRSVRD